MDGAYAAAASYLAGPDSSFNDVCRVHGTLATLYDAWDAAEPGHGHADRASEWRAKSGDR